MHEFSSPTGRAPGAGVPIPGTKRLKYLEDNLGAISVRLTLKDLEQINTVLPAGITSGARYPERAMQAIDR
jgi:hypothetical protein